jgi:DNA-binding response OmpR family regulator
MEAETLQASKDTLLIVDDEPLMTELFEKFMSKRGFRVLTAASGSEALRIIEREKESIRLVLTDVTMPVMDGLTLAGELLKFAPSVPVMLATGHDADLDTVGGLPNVIAVVRKPYQNRDLAEQIRDVLDGHQPERPY